MSNRKANAYSARMNHVFEYIYQHLDEDLTLEKMSRVAHFSRFHFHRQFSEYCGMTLSRFVQLMRLKRASYRLVFDRDDRITDIALEARFENPESFSRAFKQVFGQTPSQFRTEPDWPNWHDRIQIHLPRVERTHDMNIKIVDFEETRVAVLEHRGSPDRVMDSVGLFRQWRKQSRLSPVRTSKSFGIIYDDPENTPPEQFRFDICGSVTGEVPANPQNIKSGVIPAGRCAVTRHYGSLDNVRDSVIPLYRDWLPQSGEELRDYPLFFEYLNLIPDVDEHELETDIYLPLK